MAQMFYIYIVVRLGLHDQIVFAKVPTPFNQFSQSF